MGNSARRKLFEWGFLLSFGMALTLSVFWVISRFSDRATDHFRVSTSQSVQDDLHLLVGEGDFSLCDQFETDASGKVRPLIIDPRDPQTILGSGDRTGRFTIPGIDLRYHRDARSGYVCWSVRLSLLIPVVILLACASLFRHRLKVLRARINEGAG